MLGGVGRVPGNGHPYPISVAFRLRVIVAEFRSRDTGQPEAPREDNRIEYSIPVNPRRRLCV